MLWFASACGVVDPEYRGNDFNFDFTSDAVVSGLKAGSMIMDATYNGQLLCAARTRTQPDMLVGRTNIENLHHIDALRGYREHDVKNCAQSVFLGITLGPTCSYTSHQCFLDPVDRITGAN